MDRVLVSTLSSIKTRRRVSPGRRSGGQTFRTTVHGDYRLRHDCSLVWAVCLSAAEAVVEQLRDFILFITLVQQIDQSCCTLACCRCAVTQAPSVKLLPGHVHFNHVNSRNHKHFICRREWWGPSSSSRRPARTFCSVQCFSSCTPSTFHTSS